MKYEAFFLCDICGHKWNTHYDRLKSVEQGDVCENCLQRPPYRENYRGCIAEPYFYRKLDNEPQRDT
jgi:DNA replicative helicase MCM subunit Mcm2 (Cdc46/Mcm family)